MCGGGRGVLQSATRWGKRCKGPILFVVGFKPQAKVQAIAQEQTEIRSRVREKSGKDRPWEAHVLELRGDGTKRV